MSYFTNSGFQERQAAATTAKKALLERSKEIAADPAIAQRRAERQELAKARQVRAEARAAEKKVAAEKMAADAARAEEANQQAAAEAALLQVALQHEEDQRQMAVLAEQKTARDAKYAARKAAKKDRRKGGALQR